MIWDFIQNQILGMMWLNELIGFGLSAIGLDTSGRIGGSVQFFIYDTLKITILLCFLIFLISYIQSYFPPERSKKILGRFHGIWANIISALLGTVTPFCSCSSIPLFIGFTSAGLPLGVTFFPYGGHRKSCIAYEYLWGKSRCHLCGGRACDCRSRWYNYRKAPHGKIC